jgi:nucleotide-binding universal stress UspA family protein
MAANDKSKASAEDALRKASQAVAELRETIGLPSDSVAREISAKIAALAKERGVIVEWDVRVVRPGGTVEAICNCHCYA